MFEQRRNSKLFLNEFIYISFYSYRGISMKVTTSFTEDEDGANRADLNLSALNNSALMEDEEDEERERQERVMENLERRCRMEERYSEDIVKANKK